MSKLESFYSEKSLLSGLISHPLLIEEVLLKLERHHFSSKENREIFDVIFSLNTNGSDINYETVQDTILKYNMPVRSSLLGEIEQIAQTEDQTREDCDKVINLAMRREVKKAVLALTQIYDDGTINNNLLLEAVSKLSTNLFNVAGNNLSTKYSINYSLELLINTVDENFNKDEECPTYGIKTHLNEFDMVTNGLIKGHLMVVAGRPGMGADAFCQTIMNEITEKENKPSMLIDFTQGPEELALKFTANTGRIPIEILSSGRLRQEDWPRLNKAINTHAKTPIWFETPASANVFEIKNIIRQQHERVKAEQRNDKDAGKYENEITGLEVVFINYLQLIKGTPHSDSRHYQLSEIVRELKSLARELNISIVAVSTLNRNLEQRPNKRPILSDLRDSGTIEDDADSIVFIYRDEIYNRESEDMGMAEIIVAKQKLNPLPGTVRLSFIPEYGRFENNNFEL